MGQVAGVLPKVSWQRFTRGRRKTCKLRATKSSAADWGMVWVWQEHIEKDGKGVECRHDPSMDRGQLHVTLALVPRYNYIIND